ncbi:MAG: type II toxin-antitoxin system VapC family toxin [Candidatus Limnocylindrales bacterium]
MNAYVDASVVLRFVLGEPDALASWPSIERAVSSEIVRIECLRAIDRARITPRVAEEAVAGRRALALELLAALEMIPLAPSILERAADPFPTSIGTIDALHLASALAVRGEIFDLTFATHDVELGLAARAMGFTVEGVA